MAVVAVSGASPPNRTPRIRRIGLALGAGLLLVPRGLLRLLPEAASRRLGATLGAIWHAAIPVRRSVARANVALAFAQWPPEQVRRVVAASYRNLGALSVAALRGGPPPDLEAVEGIELLRAALAQGRGALLLSAHLGDFERLVRLARIDEHRLWVVTRRFGSAVAEGLWRRARRGGAGLFAAGEGAEAVRAALRRGEAVAYVLDQHTPPGRAVWVPFFGRPAATSPDLARLARLSGAPVLPVFTVVEDGRPRVRVAPPLALVRSGDGAADALEWTRICTAVVEAAIRHQPEQWLWIHRRWKPAPPEVAAALAASADGCVGRRRGLRRTEAGG